MKIKYLLFLLVVGLFIDCSDYKGNEHAYTKQVKSVTLVPQTNPDDPVVKAVIVEELNGKFMFLRNLKACDIRNDDSEIKATSK